MKLRMLNGAHSSLAYLGYLAGHETIGDTVADTAFSGFLAGLWREEIIPVLHAPPGMDLQGYAAQLLARFANTAIRHRTWQIAMDGSQKLPQRLLFTGARSSRARAAHPSPRPRGRPPGSAMSAASTRRASRSTFATHWRHGCANCWTSPARIRQGAWPRSSASSPSSGRTCRASRPSSRR